MQTVIETINTALLHMNQHLGIISTASIDGNPESAVVYFSSDEDLNIYITTRQSSRKYVNIVQNPNVAFVIYSEQYFQTIQIEGIATTVTDPGDQATLFSEVVKRANKNNPQPPIDQLQDSEIMFIKISTTWARFGNFEITREGHIFHEVTKDLN